MAGSRSDGDALLAALSALANPHRLRILAALYDGSTYVSKLARDLEISRPLLHMHLQKLADAGLVCGETTIADDGKAHRYFTVTDFCWAIDAASIADATGTLSPSTPKKSTARGKEQNNG